MRAGTVTSPVLEHPDSIASESSSVKRIRRPSFLFLARSGYTRRARRSVRIARAALVEAVYFDLEVRAVDVPADHIGPLQALPERKIQRPAELRLALALSEAAFNARIEALHGGPQSAHLLRSHERAMSGHEMRDVERLDFIERAYPVLHESVLQRRDD